MANEKMEIIAIQQSDTKNKKKFLGSILGISVSVYIDKLLPVDFEQLIIKLEKTEAE
jgi:hypothetical protein